MMGNVISESNENAETERKMKKQSLGYQETINLKGLGYYISTNNRAVGANQKSLMKEI